MIPYGSVKRGSSKLHPHNKCAVCSEKIISVKKARQMALAILEEQKREWEDYVTKEARRE